MWHSRPPRDPPPFMAKTILNFHFDYLKPSLRSRLVLGWPGCLGVRLFVTMPKWPQTQENDCRLRPSDQIHGKTRPDQIKPDHHNIYT